VADAEPGRRAWDEHDATRVLGPHALTPIAPALAGQAETNLAEMARVAPPPPTAPGGLSPRHPLVSTYRNPARTRNLLRLRPDLDPDPFGTVP